MQDRRSKTGSILRDQANNCELPALGLSRRAGLFAVQLAGDLADGIGNAFVEAQAFEVVDEQIFNQRKTDVEGTLGIVHQVAYHVIILNKTERASDLAEHALCEILRGRKKLDFWFGELGRSQHRATHDTGAITNQNGPLLMAP